MTKTKKFSVVPAKTKVVILRTKLDDKTESGILLPGMEEKKINEGTIVTVGKECSDFVYKGAYVIFDNFSGNEIVHNDQAYILIEEESIICRID